MFENEKTKWEVIGNSHRIGREDLWTAFLQDIHDLFVDIEGNNTNNIDDDDNANEEEEEIEDVKCTGCKRVSSSSTTSSNSASSPPSSSSSSSSSTTINWKYLYLENYKLNAKNSTAKKRTYQKALVIQNPHKHLRIGPTSDPYRVPMFGNGLETGAKKLLVSEKLQLFEGPLSYS